jgi:hypothetical protein
MQTYLCDKMPTKKVIKKKIKSDLAKLDNGFLILTFFGGGGGIFSLGHKLFSITVPLKDMASF